MPQEIFRRQWNVLWLRRSTFGPSPLQWQYDESQDRHKISRHRPPGNIHTQSNAKYRGLWLSPIFVWNPTLLNVV